MSTLLDPMHPSDYPTGMDWNKLPTETRLILAWLGLVKTNTRTGQCTVHPSAPARLRKMAREIEETYPEVEAVADDAPGPGEREITLVKNA